MDDTTTERSYPEDPEYTEGLPAFDPRDPESVRQAQLTLKARFGLDYLPTVCDDRPPPGLRGLFSAARRWLRDRTGGHDLH